MALAPFSIATVGVVVSISLQRSNTEVCLNDVIVKWFTQVLCSRHYLLIGDIQVFFFVKVEVVLAITI